MERDSDVYIDRGIVYEYVCVRTYNWRLDCMSEDPNLDLLMYVHMDTVYIYIYLHMCTMCINMYIYI